MATYVSYHDMLAHTEGLMDGPLENNYSAIFDERRRLPGSPGDAKDKQE